MFLLVEYRIPIESVHAVAPFCLYERVFLLPLVTNSSPPLLLVLVRAHVAHISAGKATSFLPITFTAFSFLTSASVASSRHDAPQSCVVCDKRWAPSLSPLNSLSSSMTRGSWSPGVYAPLHH